MDNLFWIEAAKYQVEPLDATVATRLVPPRPSLAAGHTEFSWAGEITGTPNGDAPNTGVLKVDGEDVARQSMEHTIPLIMQWDENFDIGADTGTAVAEDYQVPFRFTGKLDKLTLTIDRPKLTPADIEKLKQTTRNNRAAE